MSDKIHLERERERSADRCQLLKVYHFKYAANILRTDQSESLFLVLM